MKTNNLYTSKKKTHILKCITKLWVSLEIC